jgi:hypothetical protein
MAFAGVSVIADGKLLAGATKPIINAGAASGYHLLVVEGYSRTTSRKKGFHSPPLVPILIDPRLKGALVPVLSKM